MSKCVECEKTLSEDERIITITDHGSFTEYFKCDSCNTYTEVKVVLGLKLIGQITESEIVKAILKTKLETQNNNPRLLTV